MAYQNINEKRFPPSTDEGNLYRIIPYTNVSGLDYFLLASTHLRALTNASIHGVIWSLFTRSVG